MSFVGAAISSCPSWSVLLCDGDVLVALSTNWVHSFCPGSLHLSWLSYSRAFLECASSKQAIGPTLKCSWQDCSVFGWLGFGLYSWKYYLVVPLFPSVFRLFEMLQNCFATKEEAVFFQCAHVLVLLAKPLAVKTPMILPDSSLCPPQTLQ